MTTSTTVIRWTIPPQVWAVLVSWGLAVILLAGLFSFWQYRQQEQADRQTARERAAMCDLLDTLVSDAPIPAGPAGDRAREGRAKILAYRETLLCPPRT